MFGGDKFEIDVKVDLSVIKQGKDLDLVGAIDQGTSSTRFLVFTKHGLIAASAQTEHKQYFPSGEDKAGWHEHDPLEIWNNTVACIEAVTKALKSKAGVDLKKRSLKAVGITNQRETLTAWNAETGAPYHNAIVWDDLRTCDIASEIADGDANRLRDKTGLPLASYFAGTKVKWLLDNVSSLQADLADPEKRTQVRFGTVDTWLVYQLTGTPSKVAEAANQGGLFITDVSNASRWLFLDLKTVSWDQDLVDTMCSPHKLSVDALPKICPSSELYAVCKSSCGVDAFDGVPLGSILGDQQAALFGQCAFTPGEAKNTYGTGLFLMMNTGTEAIPSTHGLLTTIAYQLGKDEPIVYALEGSVSHSGSTIQWMRDQLGLITKASESETLAKTTQHNDGLYFVPAFSGLFAPHWRSDARACIVGMTASHHKGHICRAALEAAAYQTKEVFDAIYADSNVQLKALKVDGGATANSLLMQFQADMVNVEVVKPVVLETTSIGAAFAAGLAVGVWKDLDEIRGMWAVADVFKPSMETGQRELYWTGWQKAVSKSKGWVETIDEDGEDGYATAEEDAEDEPVLNNLEQNRAPARELAGYSTSMIVLVSLVAVAVGFSVGRAARR